MPCPRALQCTASCDDYHWRSDDVGRIDDLKRQYALTVIARNESEKQASLGRGKSVDWLAHSEKKLLVLRQQMVEQNVAEFDPYKYLDESEGQ